MGIVHKFLTLRAVYEYGGKRAFDNVQVPDGTDKDVMVDVIMYYCGDLECHYVDPSALKRTTELFFKAYAYQLERLWLTCLAEYDPIENYDRKEHVENNRAWSGEDVTETTAISNSVENPGTSEERLRSAFNTSNYQPAEKQVMSGRNVSDLTSDGTSTLRRGTSELELIESRTHGNIGVTSSQQLLEAEREVANFSWYYEVAKAYSRFACIEIF